MRMNSALGKSLLALVREGDYAHAGEEEAIRLALESVPRDVNRRVLDAGCGRGGTARYVQDMDWGRVSGFDIEAESVKRAQSLHPDITFAACDVLDVEKHFNEPVDLIYSFNAFYAFPDQPGALCALRSVAKPGARLVIFEYTDLGGFDQSEFARLDEGAHWRPIVPATFGAMLQQAGWTLESVRTLDEEYERWYATLVARIESKRGAIISLAGDVSAYDHMHRVYQTLLDTVRRKTLGGAVILARAAG